MPLWKQVAEEVEVGDLLILGDTLFETLEIKRFVSPCVQVRNANLRLEPVWKRGSAVPEPEVLVPFALLGAVT